MQIITASDRRADIMKMIADGATQTRVAEKYTISRTRVHQIYQDGLRRQRRAKVRRTAEAQPLDNRPIDALEISSRTFNVLREAGIETVADLRLLRRADVLALPNAGRKVLAEIEDITGGLAPDGAS